MIYFKTKDGKKEKISNFKKFLEILEKDQIDEIKKSTLTISKEAELYEKGFFLSDWEAEPGWAKIFKIKNFKN